MSCSLSLTRFEERPMDDLLYFGFNQDRSCLAVGDHKGFSIFTFRPYKLAHKRVFPSGGLRIVSMLFRSNILALVGGGPKPAYERNKVILWDDHQEQPIGELSFRTEVTGVKMTKDRIFVSLINTLSVYTFEKLERVNRFDTYTSESGLFDITFEGNCVLAYPATKKGHVRVEFLDEEGKQSRVIPGHESEISCLTLSKNGRRLGTASTKGTVVRVFDTYKGVLVKEVRRGSDKATIYGLSFNRDASMICVSSSTGTVHIFRSGGGGSISSGKKNEEEGEEEVKSNRTSRLSILGRALPYLKSEWSFAWYKGKESCPIVGCFGDDDNDTLFVMSAEGRFKDLKFDTKKGGACSERVSIQFVKKE